MFNIQRQSAALAKQHSTSAVALQPCHSASVTSPSNFCCSLINNSSDSGVQTTATFFSSSSSYVSDDGTARRVSFPPAASLSASTLVIVRCATSAAPVFTCARTATVFSMRQNATTFGLQRQFSVKREQPAASYSSTSTRASEYTNFRFSATTPTLRATLQQEPLQFPLLPHIQ